MAAPRGKRGTARPERREPAASRRKPQSDRENGRVVQDLLRRALGFGFSGFFGTEELLRKAFGDSVPRDWIDFAAAQTERARRDFADRVAGELRRSLDAVDLERLAERLLREHTIEIDARIRFVPREPGDDGASAVRVRMTPRDGEESS